MTKGQLGFVGIDIGDGRPLPVREEDPTSDDSMNVRIRRAHQKRPPSSRGRSRRRVSRDLLEALDGIESRDATFAVNRRAYRLRKMAEFSECPVSSNPNSAADNAALASSNLSKAPSSSQVAATLEKLQRSTKTWNVPSMTLTLMPDFMESWPSMQCLR